MNLSQLIDIDEALNGDDRDQVEQSEHPKGAPHPHKADSTFP